MEIISIEITDETETVPVATFRLEGGPFDGQTFECEARSCLIFIPTLDPTMQEAARLNGDFRNERITDYFRQVPYLRTDRVDTLDLPVFQAVEIGDIYSKQSHVDYGGPLCGATHRKTP